MLVLVLNCAQNGYDLIFLSCYARVNIKLQSDFFCLPYLFPKRNDLVLIYSASLTRRSKLSKKKRIEEIKNECTIIEKIRNEKSTEVKEQQMNKRKKHTVPHTHVPPIHVIATPSSMRLTSFLGLFLSIPSPSSLAVAQGSRVNPVDPV